MYKLCIHQDYYGNEYNRSYPITVIIPNNGEKNLFIPKDQIKYDILHNTENLQLLQSKNFRNKKERIIFLIRS